MTYARVYDKEKNVYYKSAIYATVGTGWFTQRIVLNPNTQTFDLVDWLDKSADPAKLLVETIHWDDSLFITYKGSQMLKYKHFCKINGYEFGDINEMNGYPDVLKNYAFLADIMANKSVPVGKYEITIRLLNDTPEWKYIQTQADAEEFMKMFVGFHDSTLVKITYSEEDVSPTINAIFDNSGWFGVVELCFERVQMMKIVPASQLYSREIFDASLIVENESIFWADSYMTEPDMSYEGSIIKSLSLKWRKI